MNEKTLTKGISSFEMKCLGLIFMTLDHIGAYIYPTTIGTGFLRIIGRIAAPLFLYILINSAIHTRNKLRFAFRLYIAHILICLTNLFCVTVGAPWFGFHSQFSILSTFSYTVLLIWIIENISNLAKQKHYRKMRVHIMLAIIFTIILPISIMLVFSQYEFIYQIFIPNLLVIPYSPFFVLMGICWYFFNNKTTQSITLIFFSCISLIGAHIINYLNSWVFMDFFNTNQFWMILFLPFIFIYNGKRGKAIKWCFYIYYPLHVFVCMFLGNQL